MGDNQKIHPAPPTTPLVPNGSSKFSERGARQFNNFPQAPPTTPLVPNGSSKFSERGSRQFNNFPQAPPTTPLVPNGSSKFSERGSRQFNNFPQAPPTTPLVPNGSSKFSERDSRQFNNFPQAPPTKLLVPNGSSKFSERGSRQFNNFPPRPRPQPPAPSAPPRTIPVIKPPTKRSCLCKCLCWTISLVILLLIIIGAIAGILYLVFQPKIPNYSVNQLQISDLRLNFDATLYAKFNVKITAQNPNKKIGIYYEKGSHLSVWYSKTKLCQGVLPRFYQGHQNTTHLNVALTGQAQDGSTLLAALQEQQQTGRIPLDLKVDVPVSIKLGKLKLRKVSILGKCLLIVDSLTANNLISIKASSCKFRLKL